MANTRNCKYYLDDKYSPLYDELFTYFETPENVTEEGIYKILNTHDILHKYQDGIWLSQGTDWRKQYNEIVRINNAFPGTFTVKKFPARAHKFNERQESVPHLIKIHPEQVGKAETQTAIWVRSHAERETLAKQMSLFDNEQRIEGNQDNLTNFEDKLKLLKEAFPNVNVVIDSDIEFSRVDPYRAGETPTIRLNPNKIFEDTLIHEFGHIYVDLLGGLEDPFIKQGVESLKKTDLWNKVAKAYPHLKNDSLAKEVITTAIGLEGAELYKELNNKEQEGIISSWINAFYVLLQRLLGLNKNVARDLAKDMLTNKLRKSSFSQGSTSIQEQRPIMEEMEDVPISNKEKIVQEAIDSIKLKVAIFNKRAEKSDSETIKANVNNLKVLLSQLAEETTNQALLTFGKRATIETEAVYNRLVKAMENPKDVNLEKLMMTKNYLKAYDGILEEISVEISKDSELAEVMKEIDLNHIIAQKNRALDLYDQISKISLAWKLSAKPGRISQSYRDKYLKEFRENPPKNLSPTQLLYKEKEYVNKRISEKADEIREKEYQLALKVLSRDLADIGITDAFMVNPKNINDDVIQYAYEYLDDQDQITRNNSIEVYNEATQIFKEYLKVKESSGILGTDTIKFYDEILEDKWDIKGNKIEGKSGKIVSKYNSAFFKARSEMFKAYYKLKEEGKDDEAKAMKVKWDSINTKKKGTKFEPSDKWLNPQFIKMESLKKSNSPIAKMYDFIIKVSEKRDNNLPSYAKLGYKLPSVHKSATERLGTQTIWSTVKGGIVDWYTQADSNIYGQEKQVLVDEAGIERQSVPIHFRKNLEENQSFDVLTALLMDYHMSENFKQKSLIVADLQVMQELVASRKVTQRTNWLSKKINAVTKKEVITKGDESNAYKALNSLIETRLYGIKAIGSEKGHNVTNALISWHSKVSLALNYFSAGTNLLQAKATNWILRAGGEFYTQKNVNNAEIAFWKEMPQMLTDTTRRQPTAKLNLIHQKLGIQLNTNPMEASFAKNTKFKKDVNSQLLFIPQEAVQHYSGSIIMLSVLDTIKVLNKDGKMITKEGSITDNPINAMNLYDAMEVKNGLLVFKEGVTSTTEGISPEDALLTATRKIRKITRDIEGNYEPENIAAMQRTFYGKLAGFLRKWLEPGLKRRYRGIDQVWYGQYEDEEMKFYSRETQSYEEGMYTTSLLFLKNQKEHLKQLKFKALSEDFKKLNDQERANILRTIREAGLMSAFFIAAAMIASLAEDETDEDEKAWLYLGAYYLRRTYSELAFYSSPGEGFKVISSPTAVISLVEDLLDVAYYLLPTGWGEIDDKYEKGTRKGQLKIKKEIGDLVPVYNMYDREIEHSYKWLIK